MYHRIFSLRMLPLSLLRMLPLLNALRIYPLMNQTLKIYSLIHPSLYHRSFKGISLLMVYPLSNTLRIYPLMQQILGIYYLMISSL